jgi:hypothetical protein
VREGDGFRVSLDDAVSEPGPGRRWKQAEHVTNKLMPANSIEDMQFPEHELEDFGYYVFARLHAFVARGEN